MYQISLNLVVLGSISANWANFWVNLSCLEDNFDNQDTPLFYVNATDTEKWERILDSQQPWPTRMS